MKTRNFTLYALGLGAAISLGAGSLAAQARSTTRIPVRKEPAAMPMEAPKVDTVRITQVVHDTVMMPGRTETVTRTVDRMVHDTVMQMMPLQRLAKTYFGLGAGVAIPMDNFRNSVHDSYDLNAMVGYFPSGGTIGIRADFNYANFPGRKTGCPACPTTKLYSGMADLVARFPLDRTSHINPVFYVLGGGGIDHFTDFLPYRNSEGRLVVGGSNTNVNNAISTGLGVTAANRGTRDYHFDYNFGAGLDVNFFGLKLFTEARYVTLNTLGGNTHYWPAIAGIKFY